MVHSHSMSPHKHRVGVGILLHSLFQTSSEVFLEGSILNDGDLEGVKETQHALALAPRDTLDLFNVANLELTVRALLALDQERYQHCPLRVCVDAAACAALKGSQEERRTGGGFQVERLADVFAIGRRVFGSGILKDEDVVRLDQLLLHARRSNEDVVIFADRGLVTSRGQL